MSTNELPALMTIAEVAEMLQCTDRHIYRLEKDGKMPKALRPGALVRFRRTVIIEWIDAGCPMRDAMPSQDMKVEMTPEEATTHPETECDLPYIRPEEPGYPFAGQTHRTSIGALLGAPYTDFAKVRLTTLCQITGCQWEHMQQFILEGNELPTRAIVKLRKHFKLTKPAVGELGYRSLGELLGQPAMNVVGWRHCDLIKIARVDEQTFYNWKYLGILMPPSSIQLLRRHFKLQKPTKG